MPKRENKATIKEAALEDAFRQGFEEGIRQTTGAELIYEFSATFQGTELRRVQFSDLDTALAEAREMLLHGHGTEIKITCVAVPTQQAEEPRAVAPPEEEQQQEDDIEDAEVVDEAPSGE